MANSRSVQNWRTVVAGQALPGRGKPVTAHSLADFALSDMSGYRGNARFRVDDLDSLTNLLEAYAQMRIEEEKAHAVQGR